ncbi:unannotated protein [freshwater metagenome]|uniref:Unannotated protein n=1 Tax=freshwater metagenome TaxID=449393 RepID=A0A6J7P0U8_9ZZZZ
MTANTPYSNVKTIIVKSTLPAETTALTPSAVFIKPKTAQGWRAVSVKIQPNELASSGINGSEIIAGRNHLP